MIKYAYDTQNRVTAVTDALGKTQHNVYDINGSLLKTTDRNNTIINYTYEHAIIGTREENPVISRVSELVPFSFS